MQNTVCNGVSPVVCHHHPFMQLGLTTVLSTANTATAMNAHTQAQRKARKRADKRAQSETVAAEKKKERAKALEAPSEDPTKNNKNSNNDGSSSSSSIVASKKGDLDRLAAGFLAKGSAVKRKAAEVRVEDFVEQQPSAVKNSASSSGAAPAKKRSKKA
jgi:hypothetical protein